MRLKVALAISVLLVAIVQYVAAQPPNILFIVADDLGWNDVSLHGSGQIGTPNIDALATEGVLLNNYYVYSICSPSRASFLTGRHVIHTGMYEAFTYRTKNGYLNTSFTLLPDYLKKCCNYATHIVGKWHLGLSTKATLPTSRGFDTSFGYWFGVEDHLRHRIYGAYDFSEQMDVATQYNNTFSTPLFTERAISIMKNHVESGSEQPFFLYLAYQDVHWPLQAPKEFSSRYENNTGGSLMRKMVCAMAAHLDEGVGNVTRALKDLGLWDSTVLVFTSDNGGPTNGDEVTSSNNFPLRGGKNTLWEGGNRAVGLVRGPGFKSLGQINNEKIYATDWMPSLISMAAGTSDWQQFGPADEPLYQLGDGLNVWSTLTENAPSPRDWILIETHPPNATNRYHGDALIVGDWKIVKYIDTTNNKIQNGWFPPPGEDPLTTPYTVTCGEQFAEIYANKDYEATDKNRECQTTWCLFHLPSDPCEYHNIAKNNAKVVESLVKRLEQFQATAVESGPVGCDPVIIDLPQGGQAWRPCDLLEPIVDTNSIGSDGTVLH